MHFERSPAVSLREVAKIKRDNNGKAPLGLSRASAREDQLLDPREFMLKHAKRRHLVCQKDTVRKIGSKENQSSLLSAIAWECHRLP